ncbi:nitrogen regulation protein NR(I) [Candidatus Methylospira mobilis]|uniref:nitrogen regulation protein NR(I) n=1 Tax=Candidatus Methylospira mobilis TaxID=1808979 RepID=UPI0028E47A76|nr:nitrogen regulation protein NR(I) [Candidatus Methylospira mobilis]WNV04811.1 nitrogen regulation protein NR(I) [Candidatus Methylospira mobilis]
MSGSQSWVVDDDRSIRWVLERALQKADIKPRCFPNAGLLLNALESSAPDAILTDIRIPDMDGFTLLKRLKASHPAIPVIIMSAHSDLDSAVSAFQGGAFEYLPKPFDLDDAVGLIRRACSQGRRQRQERNEISDLAPAKTPEIIGEAPAMQEVFRAIARLARSHITVLINGESGTGKELVARALHRHSPRANKAFIALNMAAIPRDLLESELFGHERGAFTGAQSRRAGRFEQADGGTLFLDEIGDMPAELQTRLLRVLADGEFFSVGAHTPTRVDVRIIAATHQNLETLVAQGRFREDLFHRLNVIRVHIPPMRERRQDIPLLLRHFLLEASRELGVDAKVLLPDVEEYLCRLDWPGNVRQLENTCRWITVMAAGREVHLDDLPPELLQIRQHETVALAEGGWEAAFKRWVYDSLSRGGHNVAKDAIDVSEGILITTALQFTRGRRQEAAKLLGYGRNTLTRKISELKLGV